MKIIIYTLCYDFKNLFFECEAYLFSLINIRYTKSYFSRGNFGNCI